ncbi:hypothetical protein Poly21_35410 [Allorhodopirellula heiligendammensis]|uniref:Uncharacterized protein n=2 Tax=Allorhodopirellula heiligendammensis TaxID=2714739 RepID=A0A5C6BYI3_9BACT|nr:hypothetical protein Poly21_35410 [Allorhodopirellula heiligendammensis]
MVGSDCIEHTYLYAFFSTDPFTMWQIHDSSCAQPDEFKNGLHGHWMVEGPCETQPKQQHQDWICAASGGGLGIEFGNREGSLQLTVSNVGGQDLPTAAEQYVCGDAWKVSFPQSTGQYSLRMSVRVVQATATRIVWEPTFSIQTSLLDTAPSLALSARGEPDERLAEFSAAVPEQVGVRARRTEDGGQLIVLLGPTDAPFTKNRCSRTRLDLRIFGEFLEKGVIRKARPWIVMDRSEAGVSASELADYSTQLCQTPLPLTA